MLFGHKPRFCWCPIIPSTQIPSTGPFMLLDSYLLRCITEFIHLLSPPPNRTDSRGGLSVVVDSVLSQERRGEKGGLLAVVKATLKPQALQCPLCLPEKITLDRNQFSVSHHGFPHYGRPGPWGCDVDNLTCYRHKDSRMGNSVASLSGHCLGTRSNQIAFWQML